MRSRVTGILAMGTCAVLVAVAPAPAQASYPGINGKLVFVRGGADPEAPDAMWTANPDGTGQAPVGGPGTSQSWPVWSPDGTKIAFTERLDFNHLYTINADGSDATPITEDGDWELPTWRADGQQLAVTRCYVSSGGGVSCRLARMNNDGTGYSETAQPESDATYYDWSSGLEFAFAGFPPGASGRDIYRVGLSNTFATDITNHPANDTWPSWSPDSQRIVFVSNRDGDDDIWVINRDGSGLAQLTDDPAVDSGPVWSPDGTKIAFWSTRGEDADIYVMDADGSDETPVITGPQFDYNPDWQPVRSPFYARPKGATPLRASLVVAFDKCTSANRVHGPPLAHPSCKAAQPGSSSSSHLTVGTPDVNGAAANSIGAMQLDVITGNPATPADEADVRIRMDVSDVRCRESFVAACGNANSSTTDDFDYIGDVVGALPLRVTDRNNTPTTESPTTTGTVEDASIAFVAPCSNTASTETGATCSVDTTADALLPGLAQERSRAVWQFGPALVFDGGADGDASTDDGTEFFLKQGVFVP